MIPALLTMPLGGGLWIREYGFTKEAILNAQLQSLLSISDYARIAGDGEARGVATRMELASRNLLPRFDTGCWSLYQLGGSPAPLAYHRYHVFLLKQLAARDPAWREAADRWAGYLRSGGCANT